MRALQPIVPAHAIRGDFVPTVGGSLNVRLEGEEVRTEVLELHSRDVAVVKILSVTMNKGGNPYRTGDSVAVKRSDNGLSEVWVPISDREVKEQEERERAARFAKEEGERQAREDAERHAALEAQPAAESDPGLRVVTEPPKVERPAAARPRKRR